MTAPDVAADVQRLIRYHGSSHLALCAADQPAVKKLDWTDGERVRRAAVIAELVRMVETDLKRKSA